MRSFFGDAESLVMFSVIVFDFHTLVVVVGLVLRWMWIVGTVSYYW
jgi:hypothetical protein